MLLTEILDMHLCILQDQPFTTLRNNYNYNFNNTTSSQETGGVGYGHYG